MPGNWHVRFGGGPYGKGLANCGHLAVRPTQLVSCHARLVEVRPDTGPTGGAAVQLSAVEVRAVEHPGLWLSCSYQGCRGPLGPWVCRASASACLRYKLEQLQDRNGGQGITSPSCGLTRTALLSSDRSTAAPQRRGSPCTAPEPPRNPRGTSRPRRGSLRENDNCFRLPEDPQGLPRAG